jgi:hypothetical protein
MRRLALLSLLLPTLLLGACRAGDPGAELSALRAEVDQLKENPASAASAAPAPELGQQMLELQIRHARLWQAGEARNWMLTQFQLAELRESLAGVVELNGEHAAVQPNRLADLLPAMMDPSLKQMQSAIDAQDGPGFDAAYDAVSNACTACHEASDHGFLVIQRPQTPMLDNLRAAPLPAAP